jgi:hypothetical protein
VADRQPAKDGHSEAPQAVSKYPKSIRVCTFRRLRTAFGVLADGHAHQSVKMTSLGQHGQLAVNVPKLKAKCFEKEDCPFQPWQDPSSRGGDRVLVATKENPFGAARRGQGNGRLVVSTVQDNRLGSKDRVQEGGGSVGSETLIPRRTVDAGKPAVLPNGEMQDGYLTEADEELGVCVQGCEVQSFGDPVGTFAASGCQDRSNSRITDGSVQIRQPILVLASQILELVKRVPPDLGSQPESLQISNRSSDAIGCRSTGW